MFFSLLRKSSSSVSKALFICCEGVFVGFRVKVLDFWIFFKMHLFIKMGIFVLELEGDGVSMILPEFIFSLW